MEKYDSRMAHRVWDRVWADPETPLKDPGHLLMCEVQAFADYTKLLRRFPAVKSLLADTRRHIDCLRGIRHLTDGRLPDPIPAKPRDETDDTTLRRCCGQCLKTAASYRSLADDPEYGFCYAAMAEETRQHCRALLEIIGNRATKQKSL